MFHVEQLVTNPISICPSCGCADYVTHLELKDYFLSEEEFSIIKCINCGLMITYPQPLPLDLGNYYKSSHYISHATANNGIEFSIYNLIRKQTLISKTALIKKHALGNRLLDIGCATGVFLDFCSKHGFKVEGIEPDEKARNYATNYFNLQVNDLNNLTKLPEKSFDIITMWHVLEHVNDLNDRLQIVKRLLVDNGTAFIALPNPMSYDAQYYKKYWAAYDVPRHLYHFTQKSFSLLSSKHNLSIIRTVPMIYDSYYISMLSERYKTGKASYFKALYMGLKSNLYARYHDMNYSSLIYIIKKSPSQRTKYQLSESK